MSAPAEPSWFVAQTHPHAESKAAANLARQGFETYLPRYAKTVRHARRISSVKSPLFPNYIFIRFDSSAVEWRSINSTIGVRKLVGQDTVPASLPSRVIDDLRERETADGLIEIVQSHAKFRSGDIVRIRDGALDSCCGIFEARTDKDRVAILMDLLGRKSRVILNLHSIEAA